MMDSTGAAVPKAIPEPKICRLKIKLQSSRDTNITGQNASPGTKLDNFLQVQNLTVFTS